MVPSRPKSDVNFYWAGKIEGVVPTVVLIVSPYGRCLSSALVTNVCICLQTGFFFKQIFFFNIKCDFLLGGEKRVVWYCHGRCLSFALVTNLCTCLQTYTIRYSRYIFFKLCVIVYWAGKKGREGDIDNISPRPMFQFLHSCICICT